MPLQITSLLLLLATACVAAVAEGKDIKGFEPSGLFWVDPGMAASLVSALPTLPGPVAPLNLPDMKPIPDDVHYLTIPNEVGGTPYVPFATLPDNVFAPQSDPAVTLTKNVAPAKKENVKEEADELKVLGLDGIERVVVRWGFQDKALLTDVRIEAPAPRKGIVACLEQSAFRKDHLEQQGGQEGEAQIRSDSDALTVDHAGRTACGYTEYDPGKQN